jgi:hypothetical protein
MAFSGTYPNVTIDGSSQKMARRINCGRILGREERAQAAQPIQSVQSDDRPVETLREGME